MSTDPQPVPDVTFGTPDRIFTLCVQWGVPIGVFDYYQVKS